MVNGPSLYSEGQLAGVRRGEVVLSEEELETRIADILEGRRDESTPPHKNGGLQTVVIRMETANRTTAKVNFGKPPPARDGHVRFVETKRNELRKFLRDVPEETYATITNKNILQQQGIKKIRNINLNRSAARLRSAGNEATAADANRDLLEKADQILAEARTKVANEWDQPLLHRWTRPLHNVLASMSTIFRGVDLETAGPASNIVAAVDRYGEGPEVNAALRADDWARRRGLRDGIVDPRIDLGVSEDDFNPEHDVVLPNSGSTSGRNPMPDGLRNCNNKSRVLNQVRRQLIRTRSNFISTVWSHTLGRIKGTSGRYLQLVIDEEGAYSFEEKTEQEAASIMVREVERSNNTDSRDAWVGKGLELFFGERH